MQTPDGLRKKRVTMAKTNGAEQKKALQALFKDYDAANAALTKAKEEAEAAMARRSAVVKQIAETGGMLLKRGGKLLKVMSRQSKDAEGKAIGAPTYFFRGEKEVEALDID